MDMRTRRRRASWVMLALLGVCGVTALFGWIIRRSLVLPNGTETIAYVRKTIAASAEHESDLVPPDQRPIVRPEMFPEDERDAFLAVVIHVRRAVRRERFLSTPVAYAYSYTTVVGDSADLNRSMKMRDWKVIEKDRRAEAVGIVLDHSPELKRFDRENFLRQMNTSEEKIPAGVTAMGLVTTSIVSGVVAFWALVYVGMCEISLRRARLVGCCAQCRYDLAGLPSGASVCPECGHAVSVSRGETGA